MVSHNVLKTTSEGKLDGSWKRGFSLSSPLDLTAVCITVLSPGPNQLFLSLVVEKSNGELDGTWEHLCPDNASLLCQTRPSLSL